MYGEAEVGVYPSELWRYINSVRSDLDTTIFILAENQKHGVEVTLTNDCGVPFVSVTKNGELIAKESVTTRQSAMYTLRDLYDSYLNSPDVDAADEIEVKMEDRDNELLDAMEEFLCVAAGENAEEQNTEFDDNSFCEMLDDVLSVIASYGFMIYRPCMIPCGDADDDMVEYVEYPYNDNETTPDDRVEI